MRNLDTDALYAMEVINLCGGVRLGCPSGLEMCIGQDCPTVTALYLPIECGFCVRLPFTRREVYRIPWRCVECVGEDTILVRLREDELNACRCQQTRKGKGKQNSG